MLMCHGDCDDVVNYNFGKRRQANAPPSQLVMPKSMPCLLPSPCRAAQVVCGNLAAAMRAVDRCRCRASHVCTVNASPAAPRVQL